MKINLQRKTKTANKIKLFNANSQKSTAIATVSNYNTTTACKPSLTLGLIWIWPEQAALSLNRKHADRATKNRKTKKK